MKFAGFALIILTSIGSSSCLAQTKQETPIKTIRQFALGVVNNDKKLLGELLTNVPTYVHAQAYGTGIPPTNSGDYSPGSVSNRSKEELVKSLVPNLFFTQSRHLTGVDKLQEKGNEARARVRFGSGEYADLQYDFLMIKTKDGWQIFEILPVGEFFEIKSYKFFAADAEEVPIDMIQ